MRKDFFKEESSIKTNMSATVKSKSIKPFLRYNEKNGSVLDDQRFVTVFILQNGEEVVSYSKKLFSKAKVGKKINLDVSFCKMPNGKTLLYA